LRLRLASVSRIPRFWAVTLAEAERLAVYTGANLDAFVWETSSAAFSQELCCAIMDDSDGASM